MSKLAEHDSEAVVVLDGGLSVEHAAAIGAGARIELDAAALAEVGRNRQALESLISRAEPIYGITTGFGALVQESVPPELGRVLQVHLLRSHAAGVGSPMPREVVRAALAIRLNGLLLAHSGVRPDVLEHIAALLNADLVPEVPRTGSLGASGDLAPSAHAFLPLIGEGIVSDSEGRTMDGRAALATVGREPLVLEPKEGLALINGTHFMCACGALLTVRASALLDTLDLAAAASVDALRGAAGAFDERVHRLREVPGQQRSAANIRAALRDSTRVGIGRAHTQDAYSLRCAAQVHGAGREALAFLRRLVAADIDAVTDNPIVFTDPPEAISAGNFHGQALALGFDVLRIALADLGSISERRIFRLVSPSLNGALPAFLSPQPGLCSGYMIVQYVAAALLSELRALAHPVSTDSVPTSDSQEDHVSMGMTGALLSWEAIGRLSRITAFELLCACQALDCDPGAPGRAVAETHALVRSVVAPLCVDRPPADDLERLLPMLHSGAIARLLPRDEVVIGA